MTHPRGSSLSTNGGLRQLFVGNSNNLIPLNVVNFRQGPDLVNHKVIEITGVAREVVDVNQARVLSYKGTRCVFRLKKVHVVIEEVGLQAIFQLDNVGVVDMTMTLVL